MVLSASTLASLGLTVAHAGRPLNTDDASTSPASQCQFEAWVDQAGGGTRARHMAPACGLTDEIELGVEFIATSPTQDQAQSRNLDLKWVPAQATWHGWQLGLRLDANAQKGPAADNTPWRHQLTALSALASLMLREQWALHLNFGHARDHLTRADTTPYALAIAWAPAKRWQLFTEVLGQDLAMPASQGVGLRWWLIPDKLGLDAGTSRTCATPDSRTWSLGVGWYALAF